MSRDDSDLTQDIGVVGCSDDVASFRVEGLAVGGRGVGRPDGVVWFVEGALPGDEVTARVRRRHSRHVEAEVVSIAQPSPERRPAPCPVQARCGGCPWMSLDLQAQRSWKKRLVVETLQRIGGVQELAVDDIVAGDATLAYRNRVELTLGRDAAGQRMVGMHETGGLSLVDVERCLIQHDDANDVLATIREVMLSPENADCFPRKNPFRLVLRRSWSTGEILVAIRETSQPFPRLVELAERLRSRHPQVVGVVRLRAPRGGRGRTRVTQAAGGRRLEETIAGIRYQLPAASFIQVNPQMTQALVDLVVTAAGPVERAEVLDLYGGVGVFGINLAQRGARVTVCEADRSAVDCGRAAVGAMDVPGRARFVHGDVRAFLDDRDEPSPRIVVANPPRTGLGTAVARAIAALGARRIVLVSCDPATLARDARVLIDGGYRATRVTPVDLFPQTAHVETVMALEPSPGQARPTTGS